MRAVESNGGDHRAPGRFSTNRRTVLMGGVAAAAVTTLPLASPPPAQAVPGAPYDPHQRFLSLVGIGNGQILAVQADGTLFWYRNAGWATATGAWASGSGRVVGSGWSEFTSIMGSTDGSVYAVRGDGALFRYHYAVIDLATGAGSWDAAEQIGFGWNTFPEVFGFNGDLYGRSADGSIRWYHYDVATKQFTASSRLLTGFDFKSAALYADAGGVLYTFTDSMRWYQQVNGVWQRGSGKSIHASLGNIAANGVYFTGEGSFYCIPPDMPGAPPTADLVALRLNNYLAPSSPPSWANGGAPKTVGQGWSIEPMAALQGYPLTHSVTAGDTARFAISSSFATYSWALYSVGGSQPLPVSPSQNGTAQGGIQQLPSNNFLATGCGWSESISVSTSGLSSGLYALRLEGPSGLTRDIPFVVKPASGAARANIAVLLPVLTHHAYNPWGGHNQYCTDLNGHQRFLNLSRPSKTKHLTPTGYTEHTMYSDVMLLQWLKSQGLQVDVYDDLDLHANPDLFAGYSVVVLGSHAEYWSLTMRQGLYNFLAAGGNLVYAGGNGIFEAVDIDLGSGLVTYRTTSGARNYMSGLGYPSSLLLGVAPNNAAYGTFAPFKVTAASDHPLLAGTGLAQGSTFGANGYNRGASGWEMDAILAGWPGEATSDQLIAQGVNQQSGGASMIYRPTGAGGYVFSASSISFVGALAFDSAQSRLFKNVFNSMLGPAPSTTAAPMNPAPMHQVSPITPESPHDSGEPLHP